MANERLTQWYDPDQKPVRRGVYERYAPESDVAVFAYYSKLRGWSADYTSALLAARYKFKHLIPQTLRPWRGMHIRSTDLNRNHDDR